MKISNVILSAAVAAFGLVSAAGAGVVYNNPFDAAVHFGDCSYNVTCAAAVSRGDDYAAQQFTLASATVITSASFSDLLIGPLPTDVNWAFVAADGSGGLPGTILATGTDSITSSVLLGSDPSYSYYQNFFGVGTVALGAGTYYFAIQNLTSNFSDYLAQGVTNSGAAETHDGGVTWVPFYETIGGVAVALFDASTPAPEPAAWAMMLVGFGLMGGVMRRRAITA